MFYLILAIVLGFAILASVVAAFLTHNSGIFKVTGALTGILLLITLFFSITTVDARAVGIQTAFGRYSDTLSPGLQLVAPWSDVEQFTTRLQDTDLNSKDGSKNSVYVAFSAPPQTDENGKPIADQDTVAGGGNGWVNAIVRWQISSDQDDKGAKALWDKFRTFEDVQSRLVLSEAQQSVTDVSNNYTAGFASVNQNVLGEQIKTDLEGKLRRYGIVVDSVAVKGVDLDDATRASLQRIVDNINKTQAAKEEQKRAEIDNATAKLRAESGVLSAQANERYCLDVVNNWDVNKNGPLPATFNCGLGDSKTPVIIGNK